MAHGNNFESGFDGDVTTANSALPTAFNNIIKTNAASGVEFSSTRAAHGLRSLKTITPAGTAAQAGAGWSPLDNNLRQWLRLNIYFTAAPASNHRMVQFGNSAGSCLDLEIRSDMTMRLRNAYSGMLTQTPALPLNKWLRIEVYGKFEEGTGESGLRVYSEADAHPDDTAKRIHFFDSAPDNTLRGIPTYTRFGALNDVVGSVIYWDDIDMRGDIGYFGPVVLPPPPNVGPSATAKLPYQGVPFGAKAKLGLNVTDPDDTDFTYAHEVLLRSNASAVVTISDSGPTPTVTTDTPCRLAIRSTVTDPDGASASAIQIVEFYNRWWIKSASGYSPAMIHGGA